MPALFLLLCCLMMLNCSAQTLGPSDFWQQQLAYPRVQAAYTRCWPALAERLHAQHLDASHLEVFFRLLKSHR